MSTGRVLGLYRYPVKSLGGESVDRIYAGREGFVGDRVYAVVDLETGFAASAKNFTKFGKLLDVKASITAEGLSLCFPDGRRCGLAEAAEHLTAYIGRRVVLVENKGVPMVYLGNETSYGGSTAYHEKQGVTRNNSFHDSAPIHLFALKNLEELGLGVMEFCRFRPNILTDAEDELSAGMVLEVGQSVIRITKPTKRCVVVTLPQNGFAVKPDLLKNIRYKNGGAAGFYAEVVKEGWIETGDRVKVY